MGWIVSTTEIEENDAGPEAGTAMLYSDASLREVDEFRRRLGEFLARSALERARSEGRSLVTAEDVEAVIARSGWSIPEEVD